MSPLSRLTLQPHRDETVSSKLENVVLNYLADAYPTYSAGVQAGNDFTRSVLGVGFLFARATYHNLGVGCVETLLTCVFVPIPILLYYGEWIRIASKRGRHYFE